MLDGRRPYSQRFTAVSRRSPLVFSKMRRTPACFRTCGKSLHRSRLSMHFSNKFSNPDTTERPGTVHVYTVLAYLLHRASSVQAIYFFQRFYLFGCTGDRCLPIARSQWFAKLLPSLFRWIFVQLGHFVLQLVRFPPLNVTLFARVLGSKLVERLEGRRATFFFRRDPFDSDCRAA